MLPCGGLIVFLLQCLNNFFKNLITLQPFAAMINKTRITPNSWDIMLMLILKCFLAMCLKNHKTWNLNILVFLSIALHWLQCIADLSPPQELQILKDFLAWLQLHRKAAELKMVLLLAFDHFNNWRMQLWMVGSNPLLPKTFQSTEWRKFIK